MRNTDINTPNQCKPAIFFLVSIIFAVCVYLFQQINGGKYPDISQILCTCCSICALFIFMTGLCVYNMNIAWVTAIIASVLAFCSFSATIYSILKKKDTT